MLQIDVSKHYVLLVAFSYLYFYGVEAIYSAYTDTYLSHIVTFCSIVLQASATVLQTSASTNTALLSVTSFILP